MKEKHSLLIGAIFAGIGVVLGAFGAHALEDLVSADRLTTWEMAVQYQIYHALALILVGILQRIHPSQKLLERSSLLFTLGIIIFSGSLYALVLLNIGWLGAITPTGGISFIAAWLILAIGIGKKEKDI